MAPPSYADLGKACRDIFTKNYHFGLLKLDCKTATCQGIEINSGGTYNLEDGKVFGGAEIKHKVPSYGLTCTKKWNTDNVIGVDLACQDKIAPGLKLALEGTFNPDSSKKSGKFKTQYKAVNATIDSGVEAGDETNLLLNGSLVLGYKGWLAGYQMEYDTTEGKVNKNNFAFGYCSGDFQLHSNVDNLETYSCSLYQRVSNRLESGVQMAWSSAAPPPQEGQEAQGQESAIRFGIGARYLLDPCSAVRAKVNNDAQLGLSLEQKLREGVTLTLSTFIDGKNFNAGGHKVGMCLEFES